MKLPRDLDGKTLAKHLRQHWDYRLIHQVGSHLVLQTQQPTPHRLAIPAHAFLKIGTLNRILADVAAHKKVTKETLLHGL